MMHNIAGRRQTHLAATTANIIEYVAAIERLLHRITEEYDDEAFSFPILGLDQLDEWIKTMHGVLRDFVSLRNRFAPHVMNEFPHATQEAKSAVIQLVNSRFDAAVILDQTIENRINEADENDDLTEGSVVIGDEIIELVGRATQDITDFIRANRQPRPIHS